MTRLPTHPPANPASEVAKGLSDKVREFVPSVTFDGWWRTDEETPRGIVGPLTKAGILECTRYSDIGNVYRLTELGRQLRAHLLAPTCNDSLQVAEQEESNDAI